MSKKFNIVTILVMVLVLVIPTAVSGGSPIHVTLLHTNDFHGRIEPDSSGRGGSANIAGAINRIRAAVGAENVALLDAGDVYFAAPAISQLLMGESTIDIYNMMGYDLAVFGNHEFDKGQDELQIRIAQSNFPWLGANVVLEGTDWDLPAWAKPYEILELGSGNNKVRLGVLGLAGEETPEVTLIGTTEGLVFKDLTATILHYYDEVLAQADALVVVVHMGTATSGPYKGLTTVAQELIDAGKPVGLMIGGHQHQALFNPVYVGDTAIVAAGYYGRWLGHIDVSVDKATKQLWLDSYELITITNPSVTIQGLANSVTMYYQGGLISNAGLYNSLLQKLAAAQAAWDRGQANVVTNVLNAFINEVAAQSGKYIDPLAAEALTMDAHLVIAKLPDFDVMARVAYWAEVVAPIVNQPVGYTNISLVRDYNNESIMGDIVTDSMLWKADGYDDGELNGSVDIAFTNPGGLRADIVIPDGAELPYTVTWGMTFDVLPFGNTLYLMDLTGAQIQALLDQAATLYKGILQTSGASWYWYNDCGCASPTAWGAYGVTVGGAPLERDQIYRVVTNNFLAGGQDGWVTFADGTNRWDTYYDMQQGLVEYIEMLDVIDAEDIPTPRIVRLDNVVTMLHTNDTHGTWPETYYYGTPEGFAFLASAIKAERAKNPNLLLLDTGDTFQGNAFAQYFRNADLNPIAGGMNELGYDAMTLGNHEFNFGPATFATMLGQLDAPILGTINLDDDGSYGFINENVQDYINLDVDGLKVTVFGLTNPRIYRYELPTNIPGLTFYSLEEVGYDVYSEIKDAENPDLFVGLTHMGYSPYGDENDSDLVLAQNVAGIDVLIGGHSHTFRDPAVMVTSDINPDGTLIAQAGRYALNLGKVNVGFIDGAVVLREGYLIPATEMEVDPDMEAYLQPFVDELAEYTSTEIGQTTAPVDALVAYTEETSGANVQADAAVYELEANGIPVDIHLSGAMSNRKVADGATPADPVTLTVNDMYTLMPYENSLLVMEMNGPQIKAVLERGYRNYWWYKYDPGNWGGYSHYTTCMLTTNAGVVIEYLDPGAGTPPDGNNVLSLTVDGVSVNFADATTYYNVSSVNYLAAGSCNFNDAGVTLWPLDQIVADTQFYVRDSVIDYITAMDTISPAVEGRLVFQTP
ncbi:MAG TPA: 5'-nucleotidase C-terminal domain-containing protein [Anaerolineales bacterium]|nr:5'-nucleotidase C-terminal domain-containing protein [Anaerolineales bacterium]